MKVKKVGWWTVFHYQHAVLKMRKRKAEKNIGEKLAEEFHTKVKHYVLEGYRSLVSAGRECGYFLSPAGSGSANNNLASREAAMAQGAGEWFVQLCQEPRANISVGIQVHCVQAGGSIPSSLLFNGLWQHKGDNCVMVQLDPGVFIIPPDCRFLISDIHQLEQACSDLGQFDLIVMDPPWESKSVKRLKKYSMLANSDLLSLPLGALMAPGCVVGVWVTNRQAHIHFITDQLFSANHIQHVATWYWLKVTKSGVCIRDIDDSHKKPYEVLMLGRYVVPGSTMYDRSKNQSDSLCCTDGGKDTADSPVIPNNKLVVSVPCSLHSKKPILTEVLRSYLPTSPRCLEMFARNLLPHWTSWGNEVLLHQHKDFFEEVT
ncbi:N(6)-adenine-specific methyltransferase METTL4-like isoform X2 [Mya arenaria]|uniref:N(6)-adenine-specific methyltransferase METTL4-like isoform X2 n=1 Tax=Mya arenaria TaxID=6604 RepID=UPI0022E94F58|nr:N(6)-adenine-specific methyltransferase METTL4-like isoform X2 [Mya arenaria]